MFRDRAYGFGIQSDLELPELPEALNAAGDVVIRARPIDRSRLRSAAATHGCCARPTSVCLFWENFGAILIEDGRTIIVDCFPVVDESILRLPLIGRALAILLHQRGLFVLHASAVEISGAVSFLGDKGQGKSTIAAQLHAPGHVLPADDVVAVDTSHPCGPHLIPGFPYVKLRPDAVTAMGEDSEHLPLVARDYDKRCWRITQRFGDHPIPLRHIVLLEQGTTTRLSRQCPQRTLPHVIAHSFTTRYVGALIGGACATRLRADCAAVPSCSTVWRLVQSDDLALLPDSCRWRSATLLDTPSQDEHSVNAGRVVERAMAIGSG